MPCILVASKSRYSDGATFLPAHMARQKLKSGTLGSSLIAGLSMPHSVSWYFLRQREKFSFKLRQKSTDDTRLSHHKEHSQTGRCRRYILPWRGLSRSQCKILGGGSQSKTLPIKWILQWEISTNHHVAWLVDPVYRKCSRTAQSWHRPERTAEDAKLHLNVRWR